MKEGLIAGHALYGKMEEKLKEVQDCAYKTGYDEGRHDEQEDWLIDGHGYCIQPLQHPREELSTQTDPPYSVNTSSQTEAIPLPPLHITTSVSTQTNPTTFAAMSQSLMLSENAKKHTDSLCSENLSKITVFSSPTRSPTSLNSPAPSTTAPALETRQKTVEFTPKVEKVDFPSNSTNSTPKTPSSSILERTDDVTRDYASPETHNDVVLQPITPSTTASSLLTRVTPHLPAHKKSAIPRVVSKPQPLKTICKYPAPTSIVPSLEILSRTPASGNIEKHPKMRISTIFNQKHSELSKSLVLDCLHQVENATTPPAALSGPTKRKLDLYGQFSSETSPPLLLKTGDKKPDAFGNVATTQPSAAYSEHSEGSTVVLLPENAQKSTETSQNQLKSMELLISKPLDWADDAKELPITPTFPQYPPRDLSCLRSASPRPFSSLRHRHSHPKKRWNAQRGHGQSWHSRTYHWRSSHPHTTFPASLNWDQDPRLFDLSNALHALGWVRR